MASRRLRVVASESDSNSDDGDDSESSDSDDSEERRGRRPSWDAADAAAAADAIRDKRLAGKAWQQAMEKYEQSERLRHGSAKERLKAKALLLQAAESGLVEAQEVAAGSYIARKYPFDEESDAQSLKWLLRAAHQGHGWSQYELGLTYLDGSLGVTKNKQMAIKWLTKGAEEGDANAQLHLARALLPGKPKQAVKWLQRAALNMDETAAADANWMLGQLADYSKDNAKAVEYFQRVIDAFATSDRVTLKPRQLIQTLGCNAHNSHLSTSTACTGKRI